MAFQDSGGGKHTNHSSFKSAEAKLKAKGPAATAISHEENDGDADDMNESDGKAMAEQHGPAVQIDIQHDHQAGHHSVHVMHPDGHEHESQHGSAAEAHRYAGEVAGGM